ncbi:MAG TPA: sugar ABC transporter permease [Anaerolineaceae bacterium]|nr:sugar ABC transporter permease [Anaerolineaceae bacterium]
MATTTQVQSVPVFKKPSLWRRIRRYRMAYAFIAPAGIAMLFIHIIPTVQAFYMSLLDLNVRTLLQFLNAPYIGFAHYQKILGGLVGSTDANIKGLYQALENSFFFTFWLLLGTMGIGLIMALLLNRKFTGRGIARTLVLLPWVVPTFVVGIIWQFIWLQRGGLMNRFLLGVGLIENPISWLIGPNARVALIIAAIWSGLPFNIVMFLSSLQVIPQDIYEAAQMDGANAWQRFRFITLQYLKPIMVITAMFGIIFNFFGFGPYNIATSMFNTSLDLGRYVNLLQIVIVRQTFNNQLYGYGAAASILMMIIAVAAVGIFYRLFRSSMINEA